MVTPEEFRAQLEQRLNVDRSPSDFRKMAAHSLLLAFNDSVEPHLRIAAASSDLFELEVGKPAIHAHDSASVVQHVAAAVAALGREIRLKDPNAASLHSVDYDRAPVFVDMYAGGLMSFRGQQPGLAFNERPVDHLSARALERLANLLPESERADVDEFVAVAESARVTTRRALREMAQVATAFDGFSVNLVRPDEVVSSTLTARQGTVVLERLSDETAHISRRELVGILDGARSRRRMFYLDVEDEGTIEGFIDEDLVPDVLRLLTRRVQARLEVEQVVSKTGRRRRPTYRLTGLSEISDETLA